MAKHDDLTQDVKTKAEELRNDAQSAIRAEADNAAENLRDSAVDQASTVANAAEAAASEFDAGSLQARAAHQVADQVEGLANRLRTTDLNSVTRDVSDFARNNPALFIGGAALVGLAAARFLKARDPQRVEPVIGEADPWSTRQTRGGSMSHPDPRDAPGLLVDAFRHFSGLMQKELHLAKAEISANVSRAAIGIAFFAVAALLAVTALQVLAGAIVAYIATTGLSAGTSALIVSAALLLIAGILVIAGKSRLSAAALQPTRAIANIQRDVTTVKGATNV